MADGELGNLRRAPRLIEHKIAKQSRFRTEGMAGGQFDAVIPVDVTDTISSLSDSASDGGGPVPEWFTESFTLTSGAGSTVTLTYIPIDYSEILTLNGIRLTETTDYTITDNVVTWANVADLILGVGSDSWTLTATYPYYDQASDPDAVLRSVTATVFPSTSIALPAAPVSTDFGILVMPSGSPAPTGAFATWTNLRNVSTGGLDLRVDIWTGVGVGSGSAIAASNLSACAVFDGVASVAVANLQSTDYPASTSGFTGTASSAAAAAVVGDIVIGALTIREGSAIFVPTGVHSETGFDSLTGFAYDAHSSGSYGGTALTAGLATAASVSSSFGVTSDSTTGWGEVITVAFTWTPA